MIVNRRNIIILFSILIAMIIIFLAMSWASYNTAKAKISGNVENSLIQIKEEGTYPSFLKLWNRDNFTDALMLNAAISGINIDDSALESALLNPVCGDESLNSIDYVIASLNTEIAPDSLEVYHYGRYWHGYLVPLRIALNSLDIVGIRILNFILIILLTIAIGILIKHRISLMASVCFFVCCAIVGIFSVVPMCMQFASVTYLMLLTSLLILAFPSVVYNQTTLSIIFLVAGGTTSYFDLLTAATLTLTFPLALAVLLRQKNPMTIKAVLYLCAIWFVGYGGVWSSKWVMTSLLTDSSVLQSATESIKFRTFNLADYINIISIGYLIIIASTACLIPWFISKFRKIRNGRSLELEKSLLIIGAIPIAWYLILLNHTLIHFWFSWRALLSTMFCWSVLYYLIKKSNYEQNRSTDTLL